MGLAHTYKTMVKVRCFIVPMIKVKVKPKQQLPDDCEYTDFTPTPCTLKKVISGGQIGVDITALRVAKKFGIKTGGYMPKGYLTLNGYKPGYSWIYGIKDSCANYRERTWKNVLTADATIRIATNFDTAGEYCTLNAIREYKKLSLDIYLEPLWKIGDEIEFRIGTEELAYWIVSNGIVTLNVAGNSNPDIELKCYAYLFKVFSIIKRGRK